MQRGSLVRNRYGFFEFDPKPSVEDLEAMYRLTYHGAEHSRKPIAPKSDAERTWIRRCLDFRHSVVTEHLGSRHAPSMLDVGAGGGWALAYYSAIGWQCLGVDLSADSCSAHNPEMVQHLRVTPLLDGLAAAERQNMRFDLVLLDNVLEHLPSPGLALELTRKLMSPGGVAVVEVPNDFSAVQESLLATGKVPSEYWVSWPEHLQYFNADGLVSLARDHGLELVDLICDFPIDLFLFCTPANYITNPAAGKACHSARMEIEQLMFDKSLADTADLYRAFAKLGMGRNIVAYFSKEV